MIPEYKAFKDIGEFEPRGWDPEKQEFSIFKEDSSYSDENEIPSAHQDEFTEDNDDDDDDDTITDFENDTDVETSSVTSTTDSIPELEVVTKVVRKKRIQKTVQVYASILQEESYFDEE